MLWVCFVSAQLSSLVAGLPAGLSVEKSIDFCTWRRTAEGQLAGGGMDGQLPVCQYMQKLPIAFCISSSPFHLLSSLSHCLHMHRSLFYLHFLSSTVCVRGWLSAELEGYNLEETWDPITDTNTQSPHSALSPPVSHMLVTAAGLSLPGTRHPACLSHSD